MFSFYRAKNLADSYGIYHHLLLITLGYVSIMISSFCDTKCQNEPLIPYRVLSCCRSICFQCQNAFMLVEAKKFEGFKVELGN